MFFPSKNTQRTCEFFVCFAAVLFKDGQSLQGVSKNKLESELSFPCGHPRPSSNRTATKINVLIREGRHVTEDDSTYSPHVCEVLCMINLCLCSINCANPHFLSMRKQTITSLQHSLICKPFSGLYFFHSFCT